MKKSLFVIFMLLNMFFSVSASAKMQIIRSNGAVTVKEATTAEIEDMFRQNGFEDYQKPRSTFPRIYMQHIPTDWAQVAENDAKHRTFIRILLPLVLKINEEIAAERANIEQLKEKFVTTDDLSATELAFLEEKAQKYEVFTRLKGKMRTQSLLRQLLLKVDVLPPSIMIATAAIYTDWGNSRLALDANSLYLQEVWYSDEGILPQDDPDGGYRYKEYATLEDCIRDRAHTLNTHINYDYLREARKISRSMQRPPYGEQLAAKMLNDSNLPNISGLIDYTFTFYKLNRTDFFPQLRDVE